MYTCPICGKQNDRLYYSGEFEGICSTECFTINFWNKILKNKEDFVFIEGASYQIGNEKDMGMRGFAGKKFIIEKDGKTIETTNLWSQGKIPDEYRDRLIDNARFVR